MMSSTKVLEYFLIIIIITLFSLSRLPTEQLHPLQPSEVVQPHSYNPQINVQQQRQQQNETQEGSPE